jgi:hypothetical protein
MRDRLLESLPLVLVGVVLLAFYLLRAEGPGLAFQPLAALKPTVAPTATPPPIVVQGQRVGSTQSNACTSARPTFTGGIAALKSALGSRMGDPLECEHAVDASGNTQQQTTLGLAYYRKDANVPCFTTGSDHWALAVNRDLLYWQGDAVDPPADARRLNQ